MDDDQDNKVDVTFEYNSEDEGSEESEKDERPKRAIILLVLCCICVLIAIAIGIGVAVGTSGGASASEVERDENGNIIGGTDTEREVPVVVDDSDDTGTVEDGSDGAVVEDGEDDPTGAGTVVTDDGDDDDDEEEEPVVVEMEPVLDIEPFISEFHYDNVGGDTGHFVEVAAPYGYDVDTLIVEFYREDGTVYQVKKMADFDHGYTYGGLMFHSMQLGSLLNGPNGIAIGTDRENGFDLIEFISYEGVIEGTQGIAEGEESVDIGVNEMEDSDTPIGFSLQKGGTGCAGDDFEWQEDTFAETPGEINAGMTITCDDVDRDPPAVVDRVCTLKVLTEAEIADHDTEDDLWVTLYGTVYDLTYYAPTHKGTAEVIYAIGGMDGTEKFEAALLLDHHHTEGKLYRTFRDFIVGVAGEESDEIEIDCDEAERDYSPFTAQ